jgi:hypothetical protein
MMLTFGRSGLGSGPQTIALEVGVKSESDWDFTEIMIQSHRRRVNRDGNFRLGVTVTRSRVRVGPAASAC